MDNVLNMLSDWPILLKALLLVGSMVGILWKVLIMPNLREKFVSQEVFTKDFRVLLQRQDTCEKEIRNHIIKMRLDWSSVTNLCRELSAKYDRHSEIIREIKSNLEKNSDVLVEIRTANARSETQQDMILEELKRLAVGRSITAEIE